MTNYRSAGAGREMPTGPVWKRRYFEPELLTEYQQFWYTGNMGLKLI